MPGSPFKLMGSREIYRNRWISVREDRVLRPSGVDGIFGIVDMIQGASVLAIDDTNNVVLTREYKYAIDRPSYEVVSGGIEPRETPLAAARRELLEEVGVVAERWIDAGCIDPFTTVVNSPNYMFVALGLSERARTHDPDESIVVEKIPLEQALAMVMAGRITHGASCVLILKASVLLGAGQL